MAATNHTTNYNLPQYIGTDKPTYLGDWNSTMGAIDTQMKTNADNASGALSAAQTAQTNANTALSTAQGADTKADTALTNAGAAQSTADNASSVASSALSTANTANGKADTALTNAAAAQTTADSASASAAAVASKLNLTSFETIAHTNMTITGGGALEGGTIYTAVNGDGSIGKIYGVVDIKPNERIGNVTIPTQLRPKDSSGQATDLTINGICIRNIKISGNVKNIAPLSVTIRSNGNVEIPYAYVDSSNDRCSLLLIACVLFLQPFDDSPIIPE